MFCSSSSDTLVDTVCFFARSRASGRDDHLLGDVADRQRHRKRNDRARADRDVVVLVVVEAESFATSAYRPGARFRKCASPCESVTARVWTPATPR